MLVVMVGSAALERDPHSALEMLAFTLSRCTFLLGPTCEDAFAACISLASRSLVEMIASADVKHRALLPRTRLVAAEKSAPAGRLVALLRGEGSPAWERLADRCGPPTPPAAG